MTEVASETAPERPQHPRLVAIGEVVAIFLLFLMFAAWPAPDVNEAHYLAKAKHYWNPDWSPDDHFLGSADAHETFYWSFGWLTLYLPLPAVAWVGRLLTWSLLAWAWRRMSVAIVPTAWMSVLTAGLFLIFLQHCHMAGEWVIGGVEAKGFAYVLVLLGMEAIARQRWKAVWPLMGAAAAFHVLVGGWAVVAAGVAWLLAGKERPSILSQLPWLILGGLLSLPGLLPALALTRSAAPSIVVDANRIYVFERLRHHLVFLMLPKEYVIRHGCLLAAWCVTWILSRKADAMRRVNGFIFGAVVIALIGIAIDYATYDNEQLAAKLLRFYWFRMSDVMLPLGTALGLMTCTQWLVNREGQASRVTGQVLVSLAVLAVAINVIWNSRQRQLDPRPRADAQSLPTYNDDLAKNEQIFEDWRNACYWIEANTPTDARFLTPYDQQTFKWYAQRSEIVSKKDIPQDAEGIVEWRDRFDRVYPDRIRKLGFTERSDQQIAELAREYGANYILLEVGMSKRPLSFPRLYPNHFAANKSYEVYVVPPAAQESEQPEAP